MTTTKDLIEAKAVEIGDTYFDECAEGCREMASYLLSPEFLRTFYGERIAELEGHPDFKFRLIPDIDEYLRIGKMRDLAAAYRTILEATK